MRETASLARRIVRTPRFLLASVFAALALSLPAWAASPLYLTSALGRASSQVPVPSEYAANISELSGNSNYVSLGLGIELTDFLALELSYFEINSDEVPALYNVGTDFPYSAAYASRAEGLQAVAKPGFTFMDRVTVFGLIGFAYQSQKAGTSQIQLARTALEERKGFQPVAGFGVDVRVWKQLMLGLEYRHLDLKLGRAHVVAARLGWAF